MACLLSRSFRPLSYQLPRVCPACPVLLPVHPSPACLFVLDRLGPFCPAVPQRAGPSYPAVLVPSRFGPFCPDAFPLRSGPDPGPSSPDRLPLTFSLDPLQRPDRKSTRLNSSHMSISYAVFCLKKKKK